MAEDRQATIIRVPPDRRDLNYDAYFSDGRAKVAAIRGLQLPATRASSDIDGMAAILSGLPFVRACLAGERVRCGMSA